MKMNNTYLELRTYTPELGVFVITGNEEDVLRAGRSFGGKEVSTSKFDKLVYGHATRRRLALF